MTNARCLERGALKVPKDISAASAVLYAAACTALGAVFVAMITMFNDWRKDRRATAATKRDTETVGAEAQLNHEDSFQKNLLSRIESLEKRDDERNQREREREQKINGLELGMENLRGQVRALVLRMEAALGSEPSQLVEEFRDILNGFRTLLDMAPITKPVVVGNVERSHLEEKTNPMFQATAGRRATDLVVPDKKGPES